MDKVTVKIENVYEDGHESEFEYVLPAPESSDEAALTRWFEDVVWEYTGDGHGIDGQGSCYTATIIRADVEELVGKNYEWND